MMREFRTFGEWLKQYGFTWVEGQEEIIKHEMSSSEAFDLIQDLRGRGALRHA